MSAAQANPLSLAVLHGGFIPGQGYMYPREQRWVLLSILGLQLFKAEDHTRCGLCNAPLNGAEFIRHCDTGCCKGEARGLANMRHTQAQNAFTYCLKNVNNSYKIGNRGNPDVDQIFDRVLHENNNNSRGNPKEKKRADSVITWANSNNNNRSGMIAIDFTCTNVAGKEKEFCNAGDAVAVAYTDKMREYRHFEYTASSKTTLGNLIGVCFDSRGGWDTHARQLLNALFHRDLGWSSDNSRLWLKRRLVRKISSVIWLHNGKMLEKALSWELTQKSKGNNTDSSAGSQPSISVSSTGASVITEPQVDDSQTNTQPSVPSPSLSQ